MRENESERSELVRKLKALDEEFADKMRKRGFQPEQAANVPLTTELARLYSERIALAEALDKLGEGKDSLDD